jgi:hypothetical protein
MWGMYIPTPVPGREIEKSRMDSMSQYRDYGEWRHHGAVTPHDEPRDEALRRGSLDCAERASG